MKPQVSIVIPTYNRLGFLGRALASVTSQTFEDCEIIVVDDGSTDGTEEFVRSLLDPRLRYIRHRSNRGPSVSRNTGCAAALGDFIAFLDSDDEWYPTKLEKQVTLCRERSVSTPALITCGWSWGTGHFIPNSQGGIHESILRWAYPIITSTILVRTEVLSAVGGFDEGQDAFQEWELTLRLSEQYEIGAVPEVLAWVHRDAGPRVSNTPNHIRAMHQLIGKYETSLKERPEILALWYYKLAGFYRRTGDLDASQRHIRASLRLWPFSARRWLVYAMHFSVGGADPVSSFSHYEQLAQLKRTLRSREDRQ